MKEQKEIFEVISRRFKKKTAMYEEIAGFTFVKAETVKKWASGDIILTVDRLEKIMKRYKLGVFDVFEPDPNMAVFQFQPLGMDDLRDYRAYISRFAVMLQHLAMEENPAIHFMADEIPIFHFMPYRYLTYFKLYAYYCKMQRAEASRIMKYEEFVDKLKELELEPIYDSIRAAYDKIPSREVWDEAVLDKLLFDIEKIDFLGRFMDPASRQRILDELLCLIDVFFEMANKACKPSGARFDFFKLPYREGKGFMLMNTSSGQRLSIKLDVINSMTTDNPGMLFKFKNIFDEGVESSTALGMGDQRERVLLYQLLSKKIKDVMLSLS